MVFVLEFKISFWDSFNNFFCDCSQKLFRNSSTTTTTGISDGSFGIHTIALSDFMELLQEILPKFEGYWKGSLCYPPGVSPLLLEKSVWNSSNSSFWLSPKCISSWMQPKVLFWDLSMSFLWDFLMQTLLKVSTGIFTASHSGTLQEFFTICFQGSF